MKDRHRGIRLKLIGGYLIMVPVACGFTGAVAGVAIGLVIVAVHGFSVTALVFPAALFAIFGISYGFIRAFPPLWNRWALTMRQR